jgi:aryl-alcohol dehydrogenase-like predicted oxidoreductase
VAIGLTATGPDQAATIDRAVTVGGFDCVQATWNLLEPSAGPALARAHDAGLGVIVKEALANGRLTSRNTSTAHMRDLAVLRAEADRLDTTIDALAVAAALAQPWADVVLSGAATVEHLQSNIAALEVTLDDEARDRLGTLAWDPDAYWDERSRLPWT